MNEIELEFLEEYKHLEKLLNDVFEVQHGVSEYIKILEEKEHLGSHIVTGWTDDYYGLKHVRHIRNKITHDQDASGCEENDIYFVKDFYERVMNQSDPLTLFNKYNQEKQKQRIKRQKEENSRKESIKEQVVKEIKKEENIDIYNHKPTNNTVIRTYESPSEDNIHKGSIIGNFFLAILAIALFVVLATILIELLNLL